MHLKDIVNCNRVCKGFLVLTSPRYPRAPNYKTLLEEQGLCIDDETWYCLMSADTICDVVEAWKRVKKFVEFIYKEVHGNRSGDIVWGN